MRQARVISEAREWIGTPYHAGAQIKGTGVDCVRFCEAVYRSAGLIGPVEFPRYTMDGGDHLTEEIVEPFILDAGFRQLDGHNKPGDLLAFKLGRITYHLGIQVSEIHFVHAIRHYGVIESHLHDSTYARRLTKIYRID